MKRLFAPLSLVIAILFVWQLAATRMHAQPQPPATPGWQRVDEAINKGLPKTAIEELAPIIQQAKADQDHDEWIRAVALRITLESNIEGNKPVERITRLEKEIATAPEATKPVMNALLANWYWQHFQQNRWRYQNRTQASGGISDDIETWDLPRILDKVDEVFSAALADPDSLKKVPVASFDEVFVKGNLDDAYRPTLYDVLAHDALAFYSAGEQGAAKSQDHFEPTASSPLLSDTADFIAWNPETTDTDSLTLRAIRLYQDLLRFHQDDEVVTAFADTDLNRIVFANSKAVGPETSERYRASLKRLIDRYADHPVSALARHYLAIEYNNEQDHVTAKEIAKEAVQKFPDSVGGRRCHNLIQQIETKQLTIQAERVWNGEQVEMRVDYRNLEQVHFRLVPFDFESFMRSNKYRSEQFDQNELENLRRRPFVKSWSVDLPPTDDYKIRSETLDPPSDLPPGPYLLVASANKNFDFNSNQLSVSEIWVTELALIVRNQFQGAGVSGLVLNAQSGEPIAAATVEGWLRQNNGRRTKTVTTRTDKEGRFEIATTDRQQYLIHVRKGEQRVSSSNSVTVRSVRKIETTRATRFFTDRAIYRPGQTIQYKGICHAYNGETNEYRTLPGSPITVALLDANRQEIERQEHRCNAYGSFSGSFTAPADVLTGRMTIRAVNGPSGQASVRVEQYKRPQFKTEIDAPAIAAKLDEEVTLTGKATAYSGAPMNGATVSYRVVREVRYPVWWYWRCWWAPPQNNSQEIAHGVTEVKDDGTYDITFTATPDASVPVESEPTFRYTVYADVTDSTGETRSASRMIQVGYTALTATVSTDKWLTPESAVPLRIQTKTLDGVGQQADGSVKLYEVKQPEKTARPTLLSRSPYQQTDGEPDAPDPTKPYSWELGNVVQEFTFETDAGGNATLQTGKLKPGFYRVILSTEDRFGKSVSGEVQFEVFDPNARRFALKVPDYFRVENGSLQPGEELIAIWGSGYRDARAFVEVEHRGKPLQQFWTEPGVTQVKIQQAVTEEMRGGFTVRVTMVHDNRIHTSSQRILVPWTNKELTVRWEHMVSKLEPGSKESWTAIISGPDAENRFAEMVATLYDASLDAYGEHRWASGFGAFYQDHSKLRVQFANQAKGLSNVYYSWSQNYLDSTLTYRHLRPELAYNYRGYAMTQLSKGRGRAMNLYSRSEPMPAAAMEGAPAYAFAANDGIAAGALMSKTSAITSESAAEPTPDLNEVSLRKNLNETAFFFPHLLSDKDGQVKLEFEMPEALTEWRFIGFAHDNDLSAGQLVGSTVTQKDIMVQPNPPRFVREGDELEFTVKVSNLSPTRQTGTVRLSFLNALTEAEMDAAIGNETRDQSFEIAAGSSQTLSWRIQIPDGTPWLIYRAVASTGRLSDGQQDFLPVLSRRVLVTESVQLPIRGPETKEFVFDALRDSAKSDSLEHRSLTVQMASNPAWYAVMALPYLMEDPYECNEQTFNRLYANALAGHIADSDPRIENVFAQWRGTKALESPLEKNADLKSVLLQETPWLRDAKDESAARRNVGILFETNRLRTERARQLKKLSEGQLPDGAWSWFPGGRENEFITLYITTGFGRLRHLGVDADLTAAIKSLNYLDTQMAERYARIPADKRDANHLSVHVAMYLYGRSFFLKDQPVGDANRVAFDYWRAQAKQYWLQLNHRQSQAHIAVAMKRLGDSATASGIMRSIKERSVSDPEMGMFWRDTEASWWWYRAPIETQAMMIEAFDEVLDDTESVEACKVWLLKQKQTRDWKTTKATADAVYALLLRGTNLLSSTQLVAVELAGKPVQPESVEAGTGFYEKRFLTDQVSPDQHQIRVIKGNEGVAWGSVHWQYLENLENIPASDDGPLSLTKQYFVKKNTSQGPTLVPIDSPDEKSIQVGEELVARIVLRSDRDMEYVHLKDHRASGTEPVNVLSRYRFQDGLAYYESTQDTATHFFIDYLPKGTYVFQYSVRVQHRGNYETGLANIQCMYAPEFNSHSESVALEVK